MLNEYFRLYRWNLLNSASQISYLFEDLMPLKGIGVLMGDSGTGKTQFALRMAMCLATGQPLVTHLDSEFFTCGVPCVKGATAYFVGEGKDGICKRIIATWKSHNQTDPIASEFPIVVLEAGKLRLNDTAKPEHMASEMYPYLWSECRKNSVRLIVFDTLAASFDIHDENNNSEMQRYVQVLNRFSEHFQCFVLVIAHPPKSRDRVKGFSRGASALINSADVVLELSKMNASSYRQLTVTKMRDGPSAGLKFKLKMQVFDQAPTLVPAFDEKTENEVPFTADEAISEDSKTVVAIMQKSPRGTWLTKQNILEKFEHEYMRRRQSEGHASGKKTSVEKQLQRVLRKLRDKEVVVRRGAGKNIVYALTHTMPRVHNSA